MLAQQYQASPRSSELPCLYVDECVNQANTFSNKRVKNFMMMGVGIGLVRQNSDELRYVGYVYDVIECNDRDSWMWMADMSFKLLRDIFVKENPERIYACNNIGRWLEEYIYTKHFKNGWTDPYAEKIYERMERLTWKRDHHSKHYDLKEEVGDRIGYIVGEEIIKIRKALMSKEIDIRMLFPEIMA